MIIRSLVAALLAISLFATVVVAEESAPGPVSSKLSADEMRRVKTGEIILRGGTAADGETGSGYVIGYIKAPSENCWATLIDLEAQSQYMPKLVSAKLAAVNGNKRNADFVLDMGITNIEFSTIQTLQPGKKRMSWILDTSKPADYLTRTNGFWQFEQVDGGTLAQYSIDMVVELPIIGGLFKGIIRSLAQDDLPDVIAAIRKRIESGNTWKK
jgi:carbon monoxide dehydrogenase subunit G